MLLDAIRRRYDGLTNLVTRLGQVGIDKSASTRYRPTSAPLSYVEVDALYEENGIAAKIIDRPADELTRTWLDITDINADVDMAAVTSEVETFSLRKHVSNLYRWGSKEGGAVMGVAVDDGLMPHEPLDLTRIRKVHGFFILDRHQLVPVIRGEKPPEAYVIQGEAPEGIAGRVIHASRLVKFVGVEPSPRRALAHQFWGTGVLQRGWESLRQYLSAHGYAEAILHEASLDVYRLEGWNAISTAKGEDAWLKRLMSMNLAKSVLGGIVLDKQDEFTALSKSMAGYADLIEKFVQAVVACYPIPRSVLLNETPGGLNSGSNRGEMQAWYDWLETQRKDHATAWVNWALEIIFASQAGPTSGRVPEHWEIEWRPLWAPTAKETEETRKLRTETDLLLMDAGVVTDREIRRHRLVNGLATEFAIAAEDLDELEELEGDDQEPPPLPPGFQPASSPVPGKMPQQAPGPFQVPPGDDE